jgi:predicted 3-demethylubiquinone-9 3-methyltransferase (glyoxalase superfamily)
MVREGRGGDHTLLRVAIPFYVSIVPDSRLDHIQRSPAAWPGAEAGDIVVISSPVTEIIWGRNDRPDAIREHELPF